MNYLLFFFYLLLFCWLLTKIRLIQNTNIGNRLIIILFLLRVLAGLANGWLSLYHYSISDSVGFHLEGINEYRLMFQNPREYFIKLFASSYKNPYGAVFDITDSFWNNLKGNILIKLLSIFDIFSNLNYFINILFYNFLVFFGSIFLYTIFIQHFPNRKNTLLITLFLLPSFLYFTSGIHRDGLIFLAIALVSFNLFCLLKTGGLSLKRVIYLAFNLALIFILRNFVFIAILPAITAWIITVKKTFASLPVFILVYIFFGALFFSLKFIHPKLDLPQYVSARQIAFINLSKTAGSAININPLFPNFRSFFNNGPQALNHTLMRPYFSEVKDAFYLPVALEIFIYEILFLLYLLFPLKNYGQKAFLYYAAFFGLSVCLIIGYTIPIIGALIRYRSIYLPLLLTPLCCLIDINKIKERYYNLT